MRSTTPASRDAWRPRSARARAWGVLLGAGLGAALGWACTLSVDDGISCGDGYVDREAGEDCDPADVDSYIHACVGTSRPDGLAACDPQTCTIINTLEQCAVCGDGRVDGTLGEECDGDELNGQSCPGGVGTLQCGPSCRFDLSACRSCGNQRIDAGEECDPNASLDVLTQGKPTCAELESPYPNRPYTDGFPGSCRDDCRWERTTCSYCGNGELDDTAFIDLERTTVKPEVCDGHDFDHVTVESDLSASLCTRADPDWRPIVRCEPDCFDFEPIQPESCCVKQNRACPADDADVQCCFASENPDALEPPCQLLYIGSVGFEACR
jgi:hypothetical protein